VFTVGKFKIRMDSGWEILDVDADKVDGFDASAFAKTDLSNVPSSTVLNKVKEVDGSNSGLDADLIDGQHASAFLT